MQALDAKANIMMPKTVGLFSTARKGRVNNPFHMANSFQDEIHFVVALLLCGREKQRCTRCVHGKDILGCYEAAADTR